jgi:hypothetical protein
LRFSGRVEGDPIRADGPDPGGAVAPDLGKSSRGIGAHHFEVFVNCAVAALVETAIVMALSGPWIWADIGDAKLGPVIDLGRSIPVEYTHQQEKWKGEEEPYVKFPYPLTPNHVFQEFLMIQAPSLSSYPTSKIQCPPSSPEVPSYLYGAFAQSQPKKSQ